MTTMLAMPDREAPAPSCAVSQMPVIERIDEHRYVVRVGGETRGFVDVVGSVLVALRGARYDRAVEVGQRPALRDAIADIVSERR